MQMTGATIAFISSERNYCSIYFGLSEYCKQLVWTEFNTLTTTNNTQMEREKEHRNKRYRKILIEAVMLL
jgi:hypothetical protein